MECRLVEVERTDASIVAVAVNVEGKGYELATDGLRQVRGFFFSPFSHRLSMDS